MRIHHVYQGWAASQPQRLALSDAGGEVRYGELPALVDGLVQRFAAEGVRAGDRVLLVAENSVPLVLCVLALAALDAWSATVNARLSAREIDVFLEHSGARLAVYFGAASPEAQAHGMAHGAREVDWPGTGPLLLGARRDDVVPEPVEADAAAQVAVLVYTSGTTGAPKAVMLTHANLLFIGANALKMRELKPQDIVYGVLPLSHVYGLSSLLVATLLCGGELRLVARFTPSAMAAALAAGVTVLHGVPAMYAKLLEWCDTNGTPAPLSLRIAQSGGAALSPSIKEGFEARFGTILHNGYGMTESAPSICQTRLDSPRTDCAVGPPIPGIEVRLHAPGANDGVGELCLRGPNVMRGYYRAPELTATVIDADGWLHTGDLARIEADGVVSIVGRSKELIIRSGFNVYPVEVEQALNAWPGIVQSAVVGRTVEGNEEVIAFVETVAGQPLDRDALAAHLAASLSPYKIPARIVELPALPAAATGKILKKQLQERAQKGEDCA